MVEAGFEIGNIYNERLNKFTGTVAIRTNSSTTEKFNSNFRKSYLIQDLSEYDLGLMKSRAGIFYRDENLLLDNEAIINEHKKEVENSNLISSSKFIKKMA